MLSCLGSLGRLSRHNHINDIICRALTSAAMPVIKKPTGLIPGTDLRPDGLTLIPWSSGRCLTWDVTVIDTLAPSNLNHSVHLSSSAVETIDVKNLEKGIKNLKKPGFNPKNKKP